MERLNILWTTDNKETALNMLFMYANNSKKHGWWQEVNIIIWGASANLVANDTQIQTEIMESIYNGISFEACKGCADNLGVSDQLLKLGINVRYTGKALTDYIKSGENILTI